MVGYWIVDRQAGDPAKGTETKSTGTRLEVSRRVVPYDLERK